MEKKYKILSNNQEFDASEYQAKIFDNIEHGIGNLIINASAGSSKTTTIVNAIRFVAKNKKILFLAFNKDIVNVIKNKINRENTTISTFHSLGFSILKENGIISSCARGFLEHDPSNIEILNIYKYNNYINNILINNKNKIYIDNIKKLVDYSRYYLAFSLNEISKVSQLYGITPINDEFEIVRNVLLWGKSNTQQIDYTDLIWLPNVLNLTTKKSQYDYIFIDEAQDTSIVEQQLIEKCFKRGTRFIAVGDKNQQINVWAGSTVAAIDLLKKHPNTIELNLPISYRCPKKIVQLAQKYSDNIIASKDSIEGEINYDVSLFAPKNGDMVLCRNTAPLIECLLKYFSNNKKAYIRGSENIKKQLIDLIKNTESELIDINCITSNGLFPKLYEMMSQKIEYVKSCYSLNEDDALSEPSVLLMYDNIESIKVLSDGLSTTNELINKINFIFDGDDNDAVQLSTIHKAKGLESDNVFILNKSLMPSKFAKKDWEILSENNLIYVAYTRAKKTLNFIKEDNFSKTNGYFSSEKLKKDVIKNINQISKNKTLSFSDFKENNFIKTNNVIELGKKVESKIIDNNKTKKKGGIKLKNLL